MRLGPQQALRKENLQLFQKLFPSVTRVDDQQSRQVSQARLLP
jgi:hypothetical protein